MPYRACGASRIAPLEQWGPSAFKPRGTENLVIRTRARRYAGAGWRELRAGRPLAAKGDDKFGYLRAERSTSRPVQARTCGVACPWRKER